jgi:hypothetical protein
MSELTLRQAAKKDWPALVKMGLDERHLKSEGVYACLCYEGGKLVGAATGAADIAPRVAGCDMPRTARLYWLHSEVPNRLDIIWALVEWHAENGLRLGHTQAEVPMIPYDARQCTNVMATPELVAAVKANLSVESMTEGRNMVTMQPAHERIIVADLKAVRGQFGEWLDRLGCKRVWQ